MTELQTPSHKTAVPKPKKSLPTSVALHVLRMSLLAVLILGLHRLSAKNAAPLHQSNAESILANIQQVLPEATSVTLIDEQRELWQAFDKEKNLLASVAFTSPLADQVSGYAGPNNLMIVLDQDQSVQDVRLLQSHDTVDHVQKVKDALGYWEQFHGWQMGNADHAPVHGVSGATLTSLAFAEAIALRLSGERASLKFPEDLSVDEVRPLIADVAKIEADKQRRGFWKVYDEKNTQLGSVFRTGSLADNIVGYQGPTELLVAIDNDEVITKIRIRRSYDNDQYVKYTRLEASFWAKFVGRKLNDLGALDLAAENIEGVSGATMTSMAVAETLKLAATRHLEELQQNKNEPTSVSIGDLHWSTGELSTAIVALLVIPFGITRARGHKQLRVVWQVFALVAIVGLAGNLLSIALLAAWVRTGPAVLYAPGLALLVGVAIAMPMFTGRNVYCDHVCPHGIVQQWMARGMRKRSWLLPAMRQSLAWRWIKRLLVLSSYGIVAMGMTWLIFRKPNQLSVWEPFDAYAWRIGVSWSVIVGVLSLVLASAEPMGYCRLACPTGKTLDYLRFRRAGSQHMLSDMLLVLLAIIVWIAASR